ncbi:MAG TPA: GIY-YIG nuclease family protein [bacterium]|nr:GIY-YIG nuclease family protein [bacterium]
MYNVYVLRDSTGRQYVGMTVDLNRRLQEHQRGKTRTTMSMRGLIVIHAETFTTRSEAREREKYLKTAAGRRFRKNLHLI